MIERMTRKRLFNGMVYRELQRSNTQRKPLLSKSDQEWLKTHDYKNVGWEKAIQLHHKISEFLDSYKQEDASLEDLFLEADRIGNKYQTEEEIEAFHQALSATVEGIAQKVDQYFPDEESEAIDFRPRQSRSAKVGRSKKRKR